MNRDIITIGASAGGVEVLLDLAAQLPATLRASVFVTIHTSPAHGSRLPELLTSKGRMGATHPVHHEEIRRGHIYVAPPDNQLLLRSGFVEVVRGPKENGHRPAVDPMFRTASAAYGSRVIGVVLSGFQDCGTAGMMAIKAQGGVAVVQSPESAVAADMPRSVIRRVNVDHVVTPQELPALLERLVAEPAPSRPPQLAAPVRQMEGEELGQPAGIVCRSCHGVLTESAAGEFHHFRCHVGHAFSLETLAQAQEEELERALWSAVRSLEESSAFARRLSTSEKNEEIRRRFSEKSATLWRQADVIRDVLLYGGPSLGQKEE